MIALGANLPGAHESASGNLRLALSMLHSETAISIRAVSRFRISSAFPPGSGPDYVNAAARIETTLDADALLQRLHAIEARIGRDRATGRWSARPIDLDLLALDDLILPDRQTWQRWVDLTAPEQMTLAPDRLILPHPRIQDRDFVLEPLAEIAPDWRHPVTGSTARQMLDDLPPA